MQSLLFDIEPWWLYWCLGPVRNGVCCEDTTLTIFPIVTMCTPFMPSMVLPLPTDDLMMTRVELVSGNARRFFFVEPFCMFQTSRGLKVSLMLIDAFFLWCSWIGTCSGQIDAGPTLLHDAASFQSGEVQEITTYPGCSSCQVQNGDWCYCCRRRRLGTPTGN